MTYTYKIMAQDFTTRMCTYAEKSARPTNVARSYDRLLRDNIHGLREVPHSTRDHVTSLITSAQHRARHGDNHNVDMLIKNAVEIMNGRNYQRVYIP